MNPEIFIQPTGCSDFDTCPCCGNSSRKIWGLVNTDDKTVACYFVHWTPGHTGDRGANFDLIVGRWGDDALPTERFAVSLEYRLLENGPAFRIIDAEQRPIAVSNLVGRLLARADVIGQPFSKDVFAYCDAILAQDSRATELLGNWMIEPETGRAR
jgi:hypothetical protein